jgi:hypothetical protein
MNFRALAREWEGNIDMDIKAVPREHWDQLLMLCLMAEFVVDGVGPADYSPESHNSFQCCLNAVAKWMIILYFFKIFPVFHLIFTYRNIVKPL